MSENIIMVGNAHRIVVTTKHHTSGRAFECFYPQYLSGSAEDHGGDWLSMYDNGWLVHFENFWTDQPQDGEDRARAYIHQHMEYTLIEVALQRFLQPGWKSYQENHDIPFECPPWITNPEAYIADQLQKLQQGWQHVWGKTPEGRLTRSIVPPQEEGGR